ncbi:CLUMA_CG015102, isoform A [Clunio marinus]|uniref:Alpha-1,3/1,6-mannosyltransferase ALG2 n=1 Tax=Clunio marinus TaxID=568069 RepID=A0A1J1IRS7_9DIPT|nr:CLUMA_CG015102, isoform A [Clunio marinus]
MRLLFLHPDLGIGGAERLVVDAAIALQNRGHTVSFLTNHHDPTHCFEETRNGSLRVRVVGDWLPRSIFGKFYAFCAYFRMVYAAFYVVLFQSKEEPVDVIFCDLISLGIPILKLTHRSPKILFYCHFPDQLLTKPGGILKTIYRMPLNYLEEKTTGAADGVLVNSKFTSRVFSETFKSLNVTPDVLYPSLVTKSFDNTEVLSNDIHDNAIVLLSINRYERKKNLPLALKSFKLLERIVTKHEWDRLHLVIAGGYDSLNTENREHYEELLVIMENLGLKDKVTFERSPSDEVKVKLLHQCKLLYYTPTNEHFGIVPLEAMYMKRPVIAVSSGGPTETIVDEQTGFLCEAEPEDFANAAARIIKNPKLGEKMGEMGRKRVEQRFSFEAFTEKLDQIVQSLVDKKSK